MTNRRRVMDRVGVLLPALALCLGIGMSDTGGARADDDDASSHKVECSDIRMKFAAPGFEVKCSDYSQAMVSVDEAAGATKTTKLFAVSVAEQTFIEAIENRILGNRFYFNRRSLEADAERYFSGADFHDWKSDDDIGDFEVKSVTGAKKDGEPMDCIAFRKLGPPRQGGISGLIIGVACSYNGRERAYDALKHLASS